MLHPKRGVKEHQGWHFVSPFFFVKIFSNGWRFCLFNYCMYKYFTTIFALPFSWFRLVTLSGNGTDFKT